MKLILNILNKLGIKATKENLTKSHIKSFIQAKYRKFFMSKEFTNLVSTIGLSNYISFPKHKQEQIIWRYNYLLNHKQGKLCLEKDECPCNCKTSEVILSDSACDKHCFPDMMNSMDWAQFKVKQGIYIDLHRNKTLKYIR